MAAMSTPSKINSSTSTNHYHPVVTNHIKNDGLYGRLALICAQNAIRMGARTQLYLCPPAVKPRLRHLLREYSNSRMRQPINMSIMKQQQKQQQQQQQRNHQQQPSMMISSSSSSSSFVAEHEINELLEQLVGRENLEEYEIQEEDALVMTPQRNHHNVVHPEDDDSDDDEQSSGDEDELLDVEALFSVASVNLDEEISKPKNFDGMHKNNTIAATTQDGGQHSQQQQQQQQPTALSVKPGRPFYWRKLPYFDHILAEERNAARSYLIRQVRRLKREWALQKRHRLQQQLIAATNSSSAVLAKDNQQLKINHHHFPFSLSPFPEPMTPTMAAALICEALALNPYESVEGMADCYDGIIAAGAAMLDHPDPTQPTRTRATRSEIMSALGLLLITKLAYTSGELILCLAKLRRMCSTIRYRRRFVQRIAPSLIRPPGSAMWCLRHQNDMEAILAATELILDAAFDVFINGWYDRGRWVLADSKRAETLKAAADQLRNLSNESPADGLAFQQQRRPRSNTYVVDSGFEPLAEWQVIAVDNQIKLSITGVLQADWTKSTISPPEAIPRPIRMQQRTMSNSSTGRGRTTPRSPRPSTPRIDERSRSPPPPPPPSRPVVDPSSSPTQSQSTTPTSSLQPPRSPRSPQRTISSSSQHSNANATTNTPLSPSSVGTTTSVDTGVQATNRRATPNTTNTAYTGPSTGHRMLTSTTADRKRTVAACRALRAQISRFEDAFIQLHGRPPKGAADRAPLSSTYAQYREWKRAIRADAACRIQALFRASLCRFHLLRSGDPDIVRVIMKRAGRDHSSSGSSFAMLNIPSPELMMGSATTAALAPAEAWRLNATTTIQTAPSTGSDDDDLEKLSFSDLQRRKRDLKQQLKQYDIEFVRQNGRMPMKPEKEPIRHLYESYNRLKAKITQMEREGPRPKQQQQQVTIPPPQPAAARQRSVSPLSSSSDNEEPIKPTPRLATTTALAPITSPVPRSAERRQLPVSPVAQPPLVPAVSLAQELAALRTEKQNLHTMLRAYERDFFRENKRQVSSFADIRPVASQYRRYKEIKKSIATLQQQVDS